MSSSLSKIQPGNRREVSQLPDPLEQSKKMKQWVANENLRLKKSMTGIKLNDKELEFAVELQRFWGVFFLKVQDMVCGSVGQLAMKVGYEANRILEIIQRGWEDTEDEEGNKVRRPVSQDEKTMLRKHFIDLCDMARLMKADMERGAAMKEALDIKRKEQEGVGPKAKPGWGRLRSPSQDVEVVAEAVSVPAIT